MYVRIECVRLRIKMTLKRTTPSCQIYTEMSLGDWPSPVPELVFSNKAPTQPLHAQAFDHDVVGRLSEACLHSQPAVPPGAVFLRWPKEAHPGFDVNSSRQSAQALLSKWDYLSCVANQ